MTHAHENSPEEAPTQRQRILVCQQNRRGDSKIAGIEEFGGNAFVIERIEIEPHLPEIIDDTDEFLPREINADLVLDFLTHPDLSYDLAARCRGLAIPVIASGRKHGQKGVLTPPTCCSLEVADGLGLYGRCFGAPVYRVAMTGNRIARIEVLRGAPCGASWDAAREVIGLPADEAVERIGLETQYVCTNDPAGWDPIWGKSPVHVAGHRHAAALKAAIDKTAAK